MADEELKGCELCCYQGDLCLPDYGLAPHTHGFRKKDGVLILGTTEFLKEVPDNYVLSKEEPGMAMRYCTNKECDCSKEKYLARK